MYQLFTSIMVILISLCIGFFLNVCIYRILRGESITLPPSHYPTCRHRLGIRDSFPIISKMYALVEAITTVLSLVLYFNFGFSYIFFEYLFITYALIVVAVVDMQTMTIKDSVVLFILAGILVFKAVQGFIMISTDMFTMCLIIEPVLGLLVGGGLFFLIAVLSKGAMGGGDIKLMAVLGLWCGYKDILLISVLSFWISAVVSLFLIVLKKKTRKDYIPFAPFIAVAAYIFMVSGSQIYGIYNNLLGF